MSDTEYIPVKNDLVSNEHGENTDDMEALKAFLLDISCLDPLSEWTDRFNLFDVLKISHYEIRHSNLLAWLLNPNETHGLGTLFLEGFIQRVLNGMVTNVDVFGVLLMDYQSFTVFREWHNIDILAVSETEKFVLCIENKFGSGEHDDQLNIYRDTVLGAFPDYKHLFVFLSPEGMDSSSPDFWNPMSYVDVLFILQNATARTMVRPEVEMLINQYKESVRREIMEDVKLTKICRDIYAKHRRALDLLFENRPDRMLDIAEIFREWAKNKMEKGLLYFDESCSDKINTRIKTQKMDEIFPDLDPDSSMISRWGSKSQYYYEIQQTQTNEGQFRMSFVVNSSNFSEEDRMKCIILDQMYHVSTHKDNWRIKTYYSTKRRTLPEELSKESIHKSLDQLWDEIMKQEAKIIAACQAKPAEEHRGD